MPDDHGMLTTYLAERDDACPGCGYNLRGLTGTRCPECNQELRLRVGLVELRLAWFVTGLIGIGMGLGFSALLLMYAVTDRLFAQYRGPPGQVWWPLAAGTVLGGALLAGWVLNRRRWALHSAQRRWALVFAAWILSLVGPVWFMFTVR